MGFPGSPRICLQCRRIRFDSWVRKIPWRRDRLPTAVFWGFPEGSDGKESTCNVGDLDSVPGLGRSPGGRHGNPFQYSCLENPLGQTSLVGSSPWGHRKSYTTKWLSTAQHWLYIKVALSPIFVTLMILWYSLWYSQEPWGNYVWMRKEWVTII